MIVWMKVGISKWMTVDGVDVRKWMIVWMVIGLRQ